MTKIAVVGISVAVMFSAAVLKVDKGEPADEAQAISTLRAVATAQRAYAALNGGYATSLKTLAEPSPGGQHGFISPPVSGDPTVTRNYEIRLHVDAHAPTRQVDCHGNQTARAYSATAVPLQRIGTATRAFAVDQNDVIWYDATGAAPKPPFSETDALKRLR